MSAPCWRCGASRSMGECEDCWRRGEPARDRPLTPWPSPLVVESIDWRAGSAEVLVVFATGSCTHCHHSVAEALAEVFNIPKWRGWRSERWT